jgi:glycosyltransferase involved in cell wall biosynthesis
MAMLHALCNTVYRFAAKIVVPAPGLKQLLAERGVPEDRIEVIHNWCDDTTIVPVPRDPELADRWGMTDKFNVVFAGVMGTVQALDVVLDAARISAVRTPNAQYVLIGGGVDVERLKAAAQARQLSNVRFVPRQPVELIGRFLSLADALLVHLKDEPLFHRMIPGKTQAYLAAGRPILMARSGDAADLIDRAGAGVTCRSESPDDLAAAVDKLSALDEPARERMGRSGRDYYWSTLASPIGLKKFERVLMAAAAK